MEKYSSTVFRLRACGQVRVGVQGASDQGQRKTRQKLDICEGWVVTVSRFEATLSLSPPFTLATVAPRWLMTVHKCGVRSGPCDTPLMRQAEDRSFHHRLVPGLACRKQQTDVN